jgi:hypothetical protein
MVMGRMIRVTLRTWCPKCQVHRQYGRRDAGGINCLECGSRLTLNEEEMERRKAILAQMEFAKLRAALTALEQAT